MRISLLVNGELRALESPPLKRLLDVLREDLGLCGTKEGCGEGECGACAVLLDGELVHSCLVPAVQAAGRSVTTIEGLVSSNDPLLPAFVEEGAVQCGFCTPGMALASRALLDRVPDPSPEEIRLGLAGNLCRCTGYSAIFRAVASAARSGADVGSAVTSPAGAAIAHAATTATHSATTQSATHSATSQSATRPPDRPAPLSLDDAVATLHRDETVEVLAGATDLLPGLRLGAEPPRRVLDITRIPELSGIREAGAFVEIGACTTISTLARDPVVALRLPLLAEAARSFGAVAVRNRATVGGNLVTASPAADLPPAMLALDAVVALAGVAGRREIPLSEFLAGYRRTLRRPEEILFRVRIPVPAAGTRQRFFKVGTRRAQAIAKVALACRAAFGPDRVLRQVRLAAGSVGPTALRLRDTEAHLEGAALTPERARRAGEIAAAEVRPIDDLRSTERYRRAVTGNLLARFLTDLLDER
jgi:carbon-monoxide dehydrogenase small subunit/xanthine dehydrogenase small subunit